MTLLHQAAQKAVEALKYMLREKSDYMRRNKLGDPSKEWATKLVNEAIEALESALQQQPEPVAMRDSVEHYGLIDDRSPQGQAQLAALQHQEVPREPVAMPAFDKKQLDAMANRFLGWRLPQTFGPDCYVSFDKAKALANHGWPVGTNLLTADEARAMLEYVLDATFIPDWSLLQATRESLREHMAMVKELRATLAASPSTTRQQEVGSEPALLFDGYYVYSEGLTDRAKQRTSPENVADVLDAVVRLMRAAPSTQENAGGVNGPGEGQQ